jgi:hypothetical protein
MNEVLRCYLITLVAPSAVDDGRDAIDRCVDPSIEKKVPGLEADAVLMLAGLPRENANVASDLTEPTRDMTTKRARAACN